MGMAVVKVGHVCVFVLQSFMLVRMRVRLRSLVSKMLVAMMFVVHVPVLVPQRRMDVPMGMLAPDEKPGAGDHEKSAGCGPETRDLAEERPGEQDRHSRGRCEQCGGPRRAQVPQGDDEERHGKAV